MSKEFEKKKRELRERILLAAKNVGLNDEETKDVVESNELFLKALDEPRMSIIDTMLEIFDTDEILGLTDVVAGGNIFRVSRLVFLERLPGFIKFFREQESKQN